MFWGVDWGGFCFRVGLILSRFEFGRGGAEGGPARPVVTDRPQTASLPANPYRASLADRPGRGAGTKTLTRQSDLFHFIPPKYKKISILQIEIVFLSRVDLDIYVYCYDSIAWE